MAIRDSRQEPDGSSTQALFFLSFHATKQLMLPALFTPQFLARLETLRIRARRQFLGSRPGGHLSPRRGTGLEFADYRHYTPGDDPRYIDWKLYSRTDRLYIKLFQEEEELYTYLFLDLSASMAYPVGNDKYVTARALALANEAALAQGTDVATSFRRDPPDAPRVQSHHVHQVFPGTTRPLG